MLGIVNSMFVQVQCDAGVFLDLLGGAVLLIPNTDTAVY
jgi:hypothetical protein